MALKCAGKNERAEKRSGADEQKQNAVYDEARIHFAEISADINSPESVAFLHDRLIHDQMRAVESVALRSRMDRELRARPVFRKTGEERSSPVVNRGRGDLMFGRKCSKNFLRVLWIFEGEGRSAVRSDDLREDANVHRQRTAKRDHFVGDERGAHEEQGKTAREQNDQRQLA